MANPPRFRAQGSVEYLIIIGVVLVIALMVISLLGFFPATAGDAAIGQSQLYWRGQAKPFTIIDSAYSNTSVCTGGGVNDRGVKLMMKNNEKYSLTLTRVYFRNNAQSICAVGNATGDVLFAPGQEIFVGAALPNATVCNGSRKSDSVKVDLRYDSPYISDKLQSGSTNLYVACN
jgi:hypothetical protein